MKMHDNLESLKKFKGFDLNLLKVFEIMYICGNGTRAGEILGVTSSAVTQSLHKLRKFFDDPLFVRERNSMLPTSLARSIHENLTESLGQVFEHLLTSQPLSMKQITIHCSPFCALRVLPQVATALDIAQLSCNINHISSDVFLDSTEDILSYRKADLVFDTMPYYSFSTMTEIFHIDETVAICRKDHPRIKNILAANDMQNENSTLLVNETNSVKNIQYQIQNYFGGRRFAYSSSSMSTILSITECTDAVSFIPRWFALKFIKSFNIKILECEFKLQGVPTYMTYHKNLMRNGAFIKLIKILRETKMREVDENTFGGLHVF